MKVLTDLHTHTVASGHAYSTLMENINCAADRGIELIAITDHGPCTNLFLDIHYFGALNSLPSSICGVTLLKGAEVNVLDETGKLDIDEKTLKGLDIVIASCHPSSSLAPTFSPETDESFLRTYTAVVDNPYINILGHITLCPHLKFLDKIIDLAKAKGKLVEINNSYFIDKKRVAAVKELIKLCMEKRAYVVINSDAHFCTRVGDFDALCEYLEQIKFPEELIVNRTKQDLIDFLNTRK